MTSTGPGRSPVRTIFLGSGTTVLEVARNLNHWARLTVITNSLLVVNTLLDSPMVTVIALGGLLRRSEFSLSAILPSNPYLRCELIKFSLAFVR